MLDLADGKWILIFDNANPELNFGDSLPEKVPWGKVIFTSRSGYIKVRLKWLSDRLIFIPICFFRQTKRSHSLYYDAQTWNLRKQRLEVSRLSSSLRYNPLAVTLPSVHFQRSQTTSDLIPAYHCSSENNDNLIHRLTSLLIEDTRVNQRMLIKFFILLGRRTVSLDIVNFCQRSHRRLRGLQTATEFLTTSNTGSAISHWVFSGLLQRQRSPSGPVFGIPSFAETAIEQELGNDPEQIANILKRGLRLVASAQDETSSTSRLSIARCIKKTVASFRRLCITARDMSIIWPDDNGEYLQPAALHYLGKTIQERRILFKRLFWRQWLSPSQYPPPASATGEENSLIAIAIFRWPTWLETQSRNNDDLEGLDSKALVHKTLVAKLWKSLLEVPSEGESTRNVVSFTVSTAGEQDIRQRCLRMVSVSAYPARVKYQPGSADYDGPVAPLADKD